MRILVILIIFTGITVSNSISKCENLVECYIFPTGINYNTYFIEISNTGIIKTSFGEKDTEKFKFIEISDIKCSILKPEDFKEIENLAHKIKNLNSLKNEIIKKGGWEVLLLIGG